MIKNIPSINEEHLNNLRAASQNRGLWYYQLLKEAQRRGVDIDFARQGIREVGHLNGHTKFPKTSNLREFIKAFMSETPRKMFEMELISLTDTEAHIEFHYCAMCAMWQNFEKENMDTDFIPYICDIAMEVDRGMFDTYDCFEFTLGDTIAAGKKTCQLCIRMVK